MSDAEIPDWLGPATDRLREVGLDEAVTWLEEYAAWKRCMAGLFGCQLDPRALDSRRLSFESLNESWNFDAPSDEAAHG